MSLRGGSRRDDIPFEDRDHPTAQYIETLVDRHGNPVHIPPPANQPTTPQSAPAAGSSVPTTPVSNPLPQNAQRAGSEAQETRGSYFGSIFNNPTGAGRELLRAPTPPLGIPGPAAMLNPVQPRPSEAGEESDEADEYEMAENPRGANLKSKAAEPTALGMNDPNSNNQDDEITEAPPLEPGENPPPTPTGPHVASNTQGQGQGDIPGDTGNTAGGDTTGGNDTGGNDTGGNDTRGNDTRGIDVSGNNASGNPAAGNNPSGSNTQRPTWWARHKARRESRRQFRANATPANNHSTPLSRCWEGCFCTPLCWCAGLVCGPIQWLAHNWCSPM